MSSLERTLPSPDVVTLAASNRVFSYMWELLLLVVVPSVLAFAVLLAVSRVVDKRLLVKPEGMSPLATGVSAFLLGVVSALGWLTWSASTGFPGFQALLDGRVPHDYSPWQIIGCGATMVLGSLVLSAKSRNIAVGSSAAIVLTAAGFASTFSLVDALPAETNPQAGIGVALSILGIGALLFVCHIPLVAFWVNKRKKAAGTDLSTTTESASR